MNRVPPQRSSRPALAAQPKVLRRKPTATVEKPKPAKSGQANAEGEAEHSWAPEAHGAAAHEAKEAGHTLQSQQHAAERAEEKDGQEALKELHEHGEKEAEKAGQGPKPGAQRLQKPSDAKAAADARAAAQKKGEADTAAKKLQTSLSHTSYSSLKPVAAAQASRLTGSSVRLDRPPDAFTLLKEAREKGVLFTEDAAQDGHTEDAEDPELAAAVEEAIARLFGVKGILRVGPGKNDSAEPIIVVVATHGFGQASMASVPEKVQRFPTMVAIPFELLPLRRER